MPVSAVTLMVKLPRVALAAAEGRLDVGRLVAVGVEGAVTETFRFPPVEAGAPVSAGA